MGERAAPCSADPDSRPGNQAQSWDARRSIPAPLRPLHPRTPTLRTRGRSAGLGHRPATPGRWTEPLPPGRSFQPHQVGSQAARAAPTTGPTRALTRPRRRPSPRYSAFLARRAGAGPRGAGHCRGPRGCDPAPGSGLRGAGFPGPRSWPPAARWTLPALCALASRPLPTPPGPPGSSRAPPGSRRGPFPPPRSYLAESWGAGPGARVRLAARPGCRKCLKTDPSASAEGGSGRPEEGSGGRGAEGGGRGSRKTRAGSPRGAGAPGTPSGLSAALAPLSSEMHELRRKRPRLHIWHTYESQDVAFGFSLSPRPGVLAPPLFQQNPRNL